MAEEEEQKRPPLKSMTPLLVIASFVSLTEIVATFVITKSTGLIQVILTSFVVIFPLAVAAAFFKILWSRPYVLYPPTEYGEATGVELYVSAMRSPAQPALDTGIQKASEATQAIAAAVALETQRIDVEAVQPQEDWFALVEKKEFDKAVARILDPTNPDALPVGIAHALAGRITLDKDKAEGLIFFERTFEKLPLESEPYVWLGEAYSSWNQASMAASIADRGIAAGADRLVLVLAKARFLAANGRSAEAITLLVSEAGANPHARLLVAAAELYSDGESILDAISKYEEALTFDPTNEAALVGIATIRVKQSRNAEALPLYHLLIEISPNNTRYHTLLGNAYLALDLNNKALRAYERANELADGREGWILANIGNLMKNRGFYHKAADFLQQSLALDPQSSYAVERLAIALKGIEHEDETEKKLRRESTDGDSAGALSAG